MITTLKTGREGVALSVLMVHTRLQLSRRRRPPGGSLAPCRDRGPSKNALAQAGADKGRKTAMRLKHLTLGLAVATALPAVAATAQAEEGIYVPLFSYRTGPFAGSGIPIANGMSDYLNMLNERDGGIGGVKLIVEECETGYDTKKGV